MKATESLVLSSARNLKSLRALFDITQGEFGKLIAISQTSIALWEIGKHQIKLNTIHRNSLRALGINPGYIDDDPNPTLPGFTKEQVRDNVRLRLEEINGSEDDIEQARR